MDLQPHTMHFTALGNHTENAAYSILKRGLLLAGSDGTAFVCDTHRVAYGDFCWHVASCASYLRAEGVTANSYVIISEPDGFQSVMAVLACIYVGAVAVVLSPRLSGLALSQAIRDSGATYALASLERCSRFNFDGLRIRTLILQSGNDLLATTSAERLSTSSLYPEPCSPNHPAFCLYTSGTTGQQRGVLHSHRTISSSVRYLSDTLNVQPRDTLYVTSKLFFAYALGLSLFGSLACGATSLLDPLWPTSERVIEILRRHCPRHFFSVPRVYQQLLDGDLHPSDLRETQTFVSAGEKLPHPVYEEWSERFERRILDSYGCTESVHMLLANTNAFNKPGSSGVPCPDVEIDLRPLEESASTVATPHIRGVLWFRCPHSYEAYITDKAIAHHTSRWIRTGDVFERDADGYLFYIGRTDDMMKRFGRWVSPSDIEHAAIHPLVRECAVGEHHTHNGQKLVVLHIVPATSAPSTLASDLHRAIGLLPPHRRPDAICFVDELPRGPTGKILRNLLSSVPAYGLWRIL